MNQYYDVIVGGDRLLDMHITCLKGNIFYFIKYIKFNKNVNPHSYYS
jgi:hypothetical protein